MAHPNELLVDPHGEIVRTQGKLRAYLSADIVAQLSEHASRQAAAFAAGLVGGLDAAISSVRAEAASHQRQPRATHEVHMARMQATVTAADPRRLAGVLLEAPQRAFLEPYRTLIAKLCADDFRIEQLHAQLTLPREAGAWIPHAVVLPFAPVAGALANHGTRMKKALDGLRPGILDFGLGMVASIGAGMLVHAIGGSFGAARTARRAARTAVRGHTGATRFSGFLETTIASLVEVREVLANAVPLVQERAHAALFALYGGAITCASVYLSRSRAELSSVDIEHGRLGLRLNDGAYVELTSFVQATVEQVGLAMNRGDWGRATTLTEEALAVFVRYRERWAVTLDGKPAAIALNELRTRVLWHAAALARRRDPAAGARILLDLVGRAPFLWEQTSDAPGAAEVARDLLALEGVIEAGQPRDAARGALVVLAQRTEAARTHGMDVTLPLSFDDVTLIRLLSPPTQSPLPAFAARFRSPGVFATLAVARDLSRRADRARVPIGPTALGFRRHARRRLMSWIAAGVGVCAIAAVGLWSWAGPGRDASEASGATSAAAATATPPSTTSTAVPATQSPAPVAGPRTTAATPAADSKAPVAGGPASPKRTAPASTAPIASDPVSPKISASASTTSQGSRTNCLRACVTSCNDDSNCERTCAAKCPR